MSSGNTTLTLSHDCIYHFIGSVGRRPECRPIAVRFNTPGRGIWPGHGVVSAEAACTAVTDTTVVCRPSHQYDTQASVSTHSVPMTPVKPVLATCLLAICRPSGCTVVSGVVVVVVGVCNRSQMRTSKCTCLIFGVSIGLDPG